ncbi:MAG: aspartate kinase [Clostridiales bacterium]|nr:aspartate kinase [Clostridiales bacterium]
MIKVVKFGGSSVASSTQFEKVKNIVLSDPKRKIVVVSAPGKRRKEDNKITDMLYLLSSHVKYNIDASSLIATIAERYEEIKTELNLGVDIKREFEIIMENVKKGAGEEYIVSRGEYLSAKLMASYLGYTFVDAQDVVKFNYDGTLNEELTAEATKSKFEEVGNMVVPGFYGAYPSGEIKLFSRGGSDVTGSLMAMAVNAERYENWTDVSGMLVADPRIVENPARIEEVTYDELRELSYMGASVLHEESVFPVRELNIPIYILNTNKPNEEGTKICKEASAQGRFVTGIAGKKNFKAITVTKSVNADKLTAVSDVLGVFKKFSVKLEHIHTSVDSFTILVNGSEIEKTLYDVLSDLRRVNGIVSVDVDNDLALVAVVGRNMVLKPGISAKIFSIFGKSNINIKTIAQGTKEINIIVGVQNADFEKAIKAVYNEVI